MCYNAIFDSESMMLPKFQVDESEYYPQFVENMFEKYIKLLDDKGIQDVKNDLIEFKNHINKCISYYYEGFISKSYSAFKDAMRSKGFNIFDYSIPVDSCSFYRARVSELNNSSVTYKSNQMFHIPYELRTKIGTQRYSIPGFPCLYLGGSAFVCWLEINKPNIDFMNVAIVTKLENSTLNVIDLSITSQIAKAIYSGNLDKCKQYLKLWPLIALCSTVVKDKEGDFKPEYIIPQFLLQWIREREGIDGIKYFTVQIDCDNISIFNSTYVKNPRIFTNFAIPVKEKKDKGFCDELSKIFCVTGAVYGKEIQYIKSGNMLQDNKNDEIIFFADGKEIPYNYTIFSTFENYLENKIRYGLQPAVFG